MFSHTANASSPAVRSFEVFRDVLQVRHEDFLILVDLTPLLGDNARIDKKRLGQRNHGKMIFGQNGLPRQEGRNDPVLYQIFDRMQIRRIVKDLPLPAGFEKHFMDHAVDKEAAVEHDQRLFRKIFQ